MPLPAALRKRLSVLAERRNLKMATAARVFLDEHVRELEEAELLSSAEEWQRAQAWATYEKIASGDVRDVPMEQFDDYARRALEQIDRKRTRRTGSR